MPELDDRDRTKSGLAVSDDHTRAAQKARWRVHFEGNGRATPEDARTITIWFLAIICSSMQPALDLDAVLGVSPQSQRRGALERDAARARRFAIFLSCTAGGLFQIDVARGIGISTASVAAACEWAMAQRVHDSTAAIALGARMVVASIDAMRDHPVTERSTQTLGGC